MTIFREMFQQNVFMRLLERFSRRLESNFIKADGKNAALFVDPGFEVAISRIIPSTKIREYFPKIYNYNSNRSKFDYEIIAVLTNGDTHHLLEYINLFSGTKKPPKEIIFIFVHEFNYLMRQVFEMNGFLHRIQAFELRIPAWIIDSDLATLELKNSFSDVLINTGEYSADAISDALNGIPMREFSPALFMIGDRACHLSKKIPSDFQSHWTHIVIFDRSADKLTPFLTPFTYEAVVAEHYSIQYGITKIVSNGESVHVVFGFSDPISSTIRNMSMPEAAQCINSLSQTIKAEFEKAKEVDTIHNMNQKIKDLADNVVLANQSYVDHLNLIHNIGDTVTKDPSFRDQINAELQCLIDSSTTKEIFYPLIALAKDWKQVVRLLAIYCQTSKNCEDINDIRQAIIDKFGLPALAALWTLDEAEVIKPGTKNTWTSLRDRLKLYSDETIGVSAPYSGYIPPLVRIIQKLCKNEWNDVSIALTDLKIPYTVAGNRPKEMKRILVVCEGGIMFGEMAGIRQIINSYRIEVDVLTTEILSASKILEQCSEMK